MTILSTLLEISKEDLEASRLLYKNNMFPHSIFYFQQSLEKLIKHLGITNEVINPEELHKEIGHKAEIIFKKLAQRTVELTGDKDFNIDNDYKKITDLNKSVPLIDLLPVVKNTIEAYRKYEMPIDFEEVIIKMIKSNNEELVKKVLQNPVRNAQFILHMKEFTRVFPLYHSSVMVLFMLNPILTNYVSIVRYPKKDSFENPSKIYNVDHTLIKYLPYFFDCQQDNIKYILNFQKSQDMIV